MNDVKISLQDDIRTITVKLAGGNPGALEALWSFFPVITDIFKEHQGEALFQIFMFLDTYRIYGTDIYVFWSDICEKDTFKTIAVIEACKIGLFDARILADACHRQDYSGRDMVPVCDLVKQVCERSPFFQRANDVNAGNVKSFLFHV